MDKENLRRKAAQVSIQSATMRSNEIFDLQFFSHEGLKYFLIGEEFAELFKLFNLLRV